MLATRGATIRLCRLVTLDRFGIVKDDFGLCAELDPPPGTNCSASAGVDLPPHPGPWAIPVNEEVHVAQGAR
jgi:hypothetical protein